MVLINFSLNIIEFEDWIWKWN